MPVRTRDRDGHTDADSNDGGHSCNRPARAVEESDPRRRPLGGAQGTPPTGWGTWRITSTHGAIGEFREVHEQAPGWIPGAINLAIALLNDTGVKVEEAKKAGGGAEPPMDNFDEALELLAGVLERDPDNAHAHFCRGIILEQQGELAKAHEHFKRVTEIDPNDASAWYWLASTADRPREPEPAAGPGAGEDPDRDVRQGPGPEPLPDPGDLQAGLRLSIRRPGRQATELLDHWKKMDPSRLAAVPGPGDLAEKRYGEMGRYANVIDPFARPDARPESSKAPPPPKFEAAKALAIKLGDGERWAKSSDFDGKNARDRPGPRLASAQRSPHSTPTATASSTSTWPRRSSGRRGVRDALLLNKGDGQFEDASTAFGLPADRASLGVAAGDFDADRHIDLFLTGVGGNRLLRNRDGKGFEDITAQLKARAPPAVSLSARWIDLDQDGDLDLYVVNYCAEEDAEKAFAKPGERADRGSRTRSTATTASRIRPREPTPEALHADRHGVGHVPGEVRAVDRLDAVDRGRGPARRRVPAHRVRRCSTSTTTATSTSSSTADGSGRRRHPQRPARAVPRGDDRRASSQKAGGSGLLVTDLDRDGRADLVRAIADGPVRALAERH